MIRPQSFTVSRETFAAERKEILTEAIDLLRPHVADALNRVGLPSWEVAIVSAALDIFDLTATAEVDELNQIISDMRELFELELGEALKFTKASTNKTAQVELVTGWVAQMAHNAAIEAATTSDPDGNVGLEWVTMGDGDVRDTHREANGQTVPTGQEFDVGGEKLLYPGQPKGDPELWIACRCLARPAMLETDFVSRETLTASAEKPFTSATIMAIPAATDPVTGISSEADGAHVTLLWLGEATFDPEPIKAVLAQVAAEGSGPDSSFAENVSGRAVLGKDKADVVLLDAAHLAVLRGAILGTDEVRAIHDGVQQFPTWIPHLTLGYPETPANGEFTGESITFDRIALWFGEDRTAVFQLGETMPEEKKVIHPEDPEFSQEMAHALSAAIAATPDGQPLPAAPAAEAPAAPAEPVLRPWHGVLAPEAAPSGDKRGFAARSLTTRDLPLPLKAMFVDDDGHKGSVVVGRIDEVYRDGGLIKAMGVWDDTPEADRAWNLVEKKMWRGTSVDLDAAEGSVVEAAEGAGQSVELSQGRVCSSTLCAIPAFAEAFVRNGLWADYAGEPLPSGDMVEIPDWPAALVASAYVSEVSADYFRNPMLEAPTPFTLGKDGHIFGHLAAWETCHIGYEVCTTAPPSATDYGYFLTGQVITDAGPVPVGQVTLGTGHAPDAFNMRQAMAHYDNTGSAVADITVFEDDHGVAFSGKIRDGVSPQKVHEMLAASLSGDWRRITVRGAIVMEMIAALAVNVPGFPIPRTRFAMEGTSQLSLTAAGIVHTREQEVSAVFSSLRDMRAVDVFNEITTLKGN